MLGLALVVALGGAYAAVAGNPFARSSATPTYQTAAAALGTVQTTVSATGPITAPATIPLSFKTAGKLTEIDVSVGQTVTAGQVLAKEDTSDLQAAVDQAQATLNQQQANLAKLQAGATPEAVAAAQAQVDAAQTGLNNAQKSLDATR
jgi:multidrug efflux pump subunit AcrA (membrane-fusion protein)